MAGNQRCGDYNQILSAYLDGEVTPAERTELLQHLASCPDCRARLEEYRAIGTRLRGLPPVVVPESLTASIYMNTVDAPPRRLQILSSRAAYPIAAVAAVLLVFIVAAFLLVDGYQRRIDPNIVGSSPSNNMMWRTSDPIRITFNKEMDKESVEAALGIQPTSERDALSREWEGNTLIIGQNRSLKPGTQYRVSITTEARDKWGNPLSEPFQLGFTTSMDVATQDETPTAEPTITPSPSPTPSPETAARAEASPTPPSSLDPTATPNTAPPTTTVQPATPTSTPNTGEGSGTGNQQPPQQQDPPPVVDPTPTNVPLPPPPTETPLPTATPVPPTPTQVPPTQTPEPTPTTEPEPESTPTQEAPEPTPTEEPEPTPTPDSVAITGPFANVYWRNEAVRIGLGDPADVEQQISVEELDFQNGKMLHNLATGEIFLMRTEGTWEFVLNTSEGEWPEFVEVDESGLYEPGGVFGYVWQSDPYVAETLGLAVSGEINAYDTVTQEFETGSMYYSIDGFIYVLYENTFWELYPDAGPLTDDSE